MKQCQEIVKRNLAGQLGRVELTANLLNYGFRYVDHFCNAIEHLLFYNKVTHTWDLTCTVASGILFDWQRAAPLAME